MFLDIGIDISGQSVDVSRAQALTLRVLEDLLASFDTVHDWHVDVQDNERVIANGLLFKLLDCFQAILSCVYFNLATAEVLFEELQKEGVVVG